MCDAIIVNGGVKTSKKVQNICDGGCIEHGSNFSCVCDEWHIVHSNELFAMSLTTKMDSQMKVCAIYDI